MTREELEEKLAEDLKNAKESLVAETVLKNILIRYAMDKGSTPDWCNSLRGLDYYTLCYVIEVVWGFPKKVKS